MNEFVSIQVSDAQPGIGTLVLSRPPTNAMTRQVYREIIAASAELGRRDDTAHKRPDVLAAIRAAGATVLFLPPYSPEFNPIERLWAKLKDFVRRCSTANRAAFDAAVCYAMDAISTEDIRAWTQFAGYDLTAS